MQIRFDQGPEGAATEFARPERIIRADQAAEVPGALAALDQARDEGRWVAGFCSYELGYTLEPRLSAHLPDARRLPLLCFGVFDAPRPAIVMPEASLEGLSWQAGWDAAAYDSAFQDVHAYIGAGDIYQANLTFPLVAEYSGQVRALYARLVAQQAVGHGVFLEADGLPAILSRSPELFFRTDAAGRIETRPMKGTQPRSNDPVEDIRAKAWLATDEKNRAENLMIVDLLRNDISRVAKAGTVHVPQLFEVESYATVHQMVSTVAAELQDGVGLAGILRALFPCGSITGAPKLRAMEIIHDLEQTPREIYCGTIGWAAPDGRSEFNVAIRTLMIEDGLAVLNVGGGIVWDSTAGAEYEEALWKARFAKLREMAPA
ncbi:aminodeoxychorismate synthase subunit I [Shimia isoporae]|uniref:Aminodeoxychorismate synthase subunit I n=1 Tax=Shimia isoporae TaxID=647720 RepID=A0A4R1NL55_9RHOB|nr:aminodeoxychorismate synthase component I [Shimia isoporae]TCL08835.1 aminodeoxychorismate synthase subunit I [Shimia isoporae]